MKDNKVKIAHSSRKRKLSVDGRGAHNSHRMTTGKDRHKENGTDPSPSTAGAKRLKEDVVPAKQENTIKFHDWEQSDSNVTITLSAGKKLRARDLDASFLEQQCRIALSDGRFYQCHLNSPIIRDTSQVQCKGMRIIVKLTKAQQGHWKELEYVAPAKPTVAHAQLSKKKTTNKRPGIPPPGPPPLQEQPPGETTQEPPRAEPPGPPPPPPPPPPLPVVQKPPPMEKKAEERKEEQANKENKDKKEEYYMLNLVKNDFFEKSTVGSQDTLVLHLYVKQLQTVSVDFTTISVCVRFQTADPKFLSMHKSTTEETNFCWKFTTYDRIDHEHCRYQHSGSMIEITMRKILPKRWGAFEEIKDKGQQGQHEKWINASNRKLETSSTPSTALAGKNSASVAFDELSGNNGQDTVEGPSTSKLGGAAGGSGIKPTCKVSPINNSSSGKQSGVGVLSETSVEPGYTGLDNLGNTCFMNSVLQVLANTPKLRDYFLEGSFQQEINHDNPLGTGGQLAVAFATLLKILWSGKRTSYAPVNLKKLVAVKSSQFSGHAQHDAQEFLAFLMDGLHEDVNRVRDKPYTETVESDGKPDYEVASQAWNVHKQRNDSVVVDMFQGQYKSKLVCPVCNKVSITFDPFMHLSVPLPKKMRCLPIIFMSKDPHRTPTRMVVKLARDAMVENLKDCVKQLTGVPTRNLRVFEVYKNHVHKMFSQYESLFSVSQHDILVVHEVLSEEMAGEQVYEIVVSQRTESPIQAPGKCANCNKARHQDTKLRRCLRCLRVAYCDSECQRADWPAHKLTCRQLPEAVGYPFLLSCPASQATYSRICQQADAMARYSVNIFQPPASDLCIEDDTDSMSTSSTSLSMSDDDSSNITIDTTTAATTTSATTTTATTAAEEEQKSEQKDENVNKDSVDGAVSETTSSSSPSSATTATTTTTSTATNITVPLPPPASTASTSSSSSGVGPAVPLGGAAGTGSATHLGSLSGEEMCGPLESGEESRKTRVVMGRQQTAEAPSHMFKLQPCDQYGNTRQYPPMSDLGDTPLPFPPTISYLYMDWKNSGLSKPFVLVESKSQLDTKDDASVSDALNKTERPDITLEQCVELFTEPEQLTPEHAWYCPSCKEHREASKQLSIWKLPDTLILHLKRFSFGTFLWRDKIDKLVTFPVRGLDLSEYMTTKPEIPVLYDLYGVVNHYGTLMGGHYTAYTRSLDPNIDTDGPAAWRSCDDSMVSSISESRVVSPAAYVLFYQRRKSSSEITTPIERPLPAAAVAEFSQTMRPLPAAAVAEFSQTMPAATNTITQIPLQEELGVDETGPRTALLVEEVGTSTGAEGVNDSGDGTARGENTIDGTAVNTVDTSSKTEGVRDFGVMAGPSGDTPYTDMDAVD